MKIVAYRKVPPTWDECLLTSFKCSGFFQTSFWANLSQRLLGAKPMYLELIDGDRYCASLMLIHRSPQTLLKKVLDIIFRSKQSFLEFSDGPNFIDTSNCTHFLPKFLKWIDDYAFINGVGKIVTNGFPITSNYLHSHELLQIYESFGYETSSWATFLVNLNQSEEELNKNIAHSTRKQINKAKRQGVIVRRINSFQEYEKMFYIPYYKYKEARGEKVFPLETAELMWKMDINGVFYTHYIASDEHNETLATLGVYHFAGTATEITSCLTERAYSMKIPAQDILHWQVMLDMKQMGCHTFDLAGVNPAPINQKEEGIRRFKEKWGGKYVEYKRYTKEFPSTSILFNILRNGNRILTKIKSSKIKA